MFLHVYYLSTCMYEYHSYFYTFIYTVLSTRSKYVEFMYKNNYTYISTTGGSITWRPPATRQQTRVAELLSIKYTSYLVRREPE